MRDAVGNKFTLEYETGIFYRISLPELSTNSLVLNCINALKQILHKDIVMQVSFPKFNIFVFLSKKKFVSGYI